MKNRNSIPHILQTVIVLMALLFIHTGYGQSLQEENNKLVKETNKLLVTAEKNMGENDFASAEATYRRAVSKNPENVTARYNMANMYYNKEKQSQAASRLLQAAKIADTKEEKHKIYHNLGNTFMEQKQYKGAVEAYKSALRNNPNDEETRYNLALAKKMLEEEPEEDGGDGENEENEDQEKDDQKGDEGEQDKDKQEGENNKDQGGDQEEDSQEQPQDEGENGQPEKQENGDPQPQQPQPGQLSPEQIKSLLEAMNNEEKKVQDKINAEKSKGSKTRNAKDW